MEFCTEMYFVLSLQCLQNGGENIDNLSILYSKVVSEKSLSFETKSRCRGFVFSWTCGNNSVSLITREEKSVILM